MIFVCTYNNKLGLSINGDINRRHSKNEVNFSMSVGPSLLCLGWMLLFGLDLALFFNLTSEDIKKNPTKNNSACCHTVVVKCWEELVLCYFVKKGREHTKCSKTCGVALKMGTSCSF